MYSCNKNSYLQGNFKNINAGLLNRCVQKAFDSITIIDEYDLQPPFNRLTSEQPHIPVENVDPTKRPQGFGRWALPILRRELHHKNTDVVLAALTSICDLVHDPEKCFEAIKLKIVDRLVDLVSHENAAIRERTAQILTVVAGVGTGKEAIAGNVSLLYNLLERVEDEFTEVRIHVAACLKRISRFWISKRETLCLLLQRSLTVLNQSETIRQMKMFEREEERILAHTCQVVTTLCVLPEGRKLAQQYNLLPLLNRLLHDERKRVHTSAAEAIMVCTIKSAEKLSASKIKSMPKRLVQLCKSKQNPDTQMFSIKALTSICEHPLVRKEVSEKYYSEVEGIQLCEQVPEIKNYKNTLMSMLKWVPYSKE